MPANEPPERPLSPCPKILIASIAIGAAKQPDQSVHASAADIDEITHVLDTRPTSPVRRAVPSPYNGHGRSLPLMWLILLVLRGRAGEQFGKMWEQFGNAR
jgi:hypothetical protein